MQLLEIEEQQNIVRQRVADELQGFTTQRRNYARSNKVFGEGLPYLKTNGLKGKLIAIEATMEWGVLLRLIC